MGVPLLCLARLTLLLLCSFESTEWFLVSLGSVSGGGTIDTGAGAVLVGVTDDGDVSEPAAPPVAGVRRRTTGGFMQIVLDATTDPVNTGGAAATIVKRRLYLIASGVVTVPVPTVFLDEALPVSSTPASTTFEFTGLDANTPYSFVSTWARTLGTCAAMCVTRPLVHCARHRRELRWLRQPTVAGSSNHHDVGDDAQLATGGRRRR